MSKIVDFGIGKIDVHKPNFSFDVYIQLYPQGTWDSYKELTAKTKQEFAQGLIDAEKEYHEVENVDYEVNFKKKKK